LLPQATHACKTSPYISETAGAYAMVFFSFDRAVN
jgi:hypothetical protein